MPRGQHTRAALIATALTVPLVVVLALVFSIGDSGDQSPGDSSLPLAPLNVTAPPSSAAAAAPCTKVLAELPVSLGDLAPRVVHPEPDSPFVVAWGDPAVILRCGVGRPPNLVAGNADLTLITNGVLFVINNTKNAHVFTAADREVYVEVAVPNSYTQPPLGPLADAIAKALPAVCQPQSATADVAPEQLCTHRQ